MTLIIGLNLSNKIYLAGDTRVTTTPITQPSEKTYIDNILKLDLVWGDTVHPQLKHDGNTIAVAVAGDVEFATYLVKRIKEDLNRGRLNSDIRIFADEIENRVKVFVNDWLFTKDYRHCCLLFSGMVKHRLNKRIPAEKLEELIRIYEKKVASESVTRNKDINDALESDSTMKQLNEKLLRDTGKGVKEMLAEGDTPEIPEYIQKSISEGNDTIQAPDTLLIGLDIDPAVSSFKKEIAEWGEYISYGVKLAKDQIKLDLVAFLELSGGKKPEKKPFMMESAIITIEILDFARKQNIMSIGGTAVLFLIDDKNTVQIIGKDVVSIPGNQFGLKLYDKIVPLMSFKELSDFRHGDKMDA